MRTIGNEFPKFNLKATVSTDKTEAAFKLISNDDLKGKWYVVFFYPKDFTFVCPTEIQGFGDLNDDFLSRETQLLSASVDTEYVHRAWRLSHPDLLNLPFPMLADTARGLSSNLGILDKNEGVAHRATFIVDPDGIIRHVSVNDLGVGRNPKEILRILDALQTDELCPCNWQKGETVIDPNKK